MANTYDYYEKNWREYCKSTADCVPHEEIDRFLGFVPSQKDLILELGSGSGNCLRYIYDKGYNISGSDYIIDIVLELKKLIPCCSYMIDFSEVEFINAFIEGTAVKHIFANAALHHLTVSEFINFINLIEVKGLLFLSLKEGAGEVTREDGRFESFYSQRQIEKLVSKRFEILSFSRSSDILNRDLNWLSWTLSKK